jgi:dTDP-4-amino-4,6-dideoxygalactose transaminase
LTAVKDTIGSGAYILGEKVAEFESKFAKYLGVKYAVGVASGTDAITLALLSFGIKSGDEVIMPANSYPSVFGVAATGAIPKLVDIDPKTLNIDPEKIELAITKKTKAILPVHLYGQPADMEKIMAIGKKYKIPIIEDCAQACGAEIRIQNMEYGIWNKNKKEISGIPNSKFKILNSNSMKVGSIGDVGCFSFYPTKNLGCFGDGGMIVTNNPDIYERLKLLRMYGEKDRYNSVIVGRNSRLDEMQAAILLVKLKYLDGWNEKRRKIAEQYFSHFQNFPISLLVQRNREERKDTQREFACFSSLKQSGGIPPRSEARGSPTHAFRQEKLRKAPDGEITISSEGIIKHIFHLFVIRARNRDKLKEYLEKEGIGTGIHYPTPIHLQKSFAFLGFKEGDFPESEKVCREVLSLPIWPEMREEEIKSVVENIFKFYKKV